MKKEVKKSQITIFVIIAVIIFLVVIIIFLVNKSQETGNMNVEKNQLIDIINQCIYLRGVDSIWLIGLQGGYFQLPEKYLETNFSKTAYGYYEGKNTLPKKEEIEKEISNYVKLTIPYCIYPENFKAINITVGEADVHASIKDDRVEISAKLLVSARKGARSLLLNKEQKAEIPIKLGKIYKTANKIIEKEINDSDSIPLSYLAKLDYYVTVIPYSKDSIIYAITDENSSIDNIPYSFMFANKFKMSKMLFLYPTYFNK